MRRSQEILVSGTKFGGLLSQLCRILPRGSSEEETGNSFSFFTSPGARVARYALNFMALDQGYIGQGASDGIMKSSRRLSVMISNFVGYLKNSSMKGQKFKRP